MSTQRVTKGMMFRLSVEVDDAKMAAIRRAPELADAALQAGAEYWHSKVLPRHFDMAAHDRYGYARRSAAYAKKNRPIPKGGKPDLVYSGSLRRDLQARAQFARGSRDVTLRMTARVLNFVPAMSETSADAYVKQRNGTGYPNLKREIRQVTDEEREAVAAVVTDELVRAIDHPAAGAAMRPST